MKPKNRRINLTRGRRTEEPEDRDVSYEIPVGAKREIRRLIEEEGCGSTTEIAKSLNTDRYPCAQADAWSANLVDSALRRQDMSDLKEKLRENRGDETTDDEAISSLAVRQAAYDGAKEAISDLALKMPEIPPLKVDTFVLKGAVCDAVSTTLKGHLGKIGSSDASTAAEITSAVKLVMKQVLSDTDLPSIRRVTDATGRNVGEVRKRIDETCAELHDTVETTLKEHSAKVQDTMEALVHEIYARVDERFDKLEDGLIEKFTAGMDIDLDAALGRVVDDRLKNHLDTVVNQFAVMIDGLRRELREDSGKRGKR